MSNEGLVIWEAPEDTQHFAAVTKRVAFFVEDSRRRSISLTLRPHVYPTRISYVPDPVGTRSSSTPGGPNICTGPMSTRLICDPSSPYERYEVVGVVHSPSRCTRVKNEVCVGCSCVRRAASRSTRIACAAGSEVSSASRWHPADRLSSSGSLSPLSNRSQVRWQPLRRRRGGVAPDDLAVQIVGETVDRSIAGTLPRLHGFEPASQFGILSGRDVVENRVAGDGDGQEGKRRVGCLRPG